MIIVIIESNWSCIFRTWLMFFGDWVVACWHSWSSVTASRSRLTNLYYFRAIKKYFRIPCTTFIWTSLPKSKRLTILLCRKAGVTVNFDMAFCCIIVPLKGNLILELFQYSTECKGDGFEGKTIESGLFSIQCPLIQTLCR